MPMREIQSGDFFLLPYSGPRRKLLVKAIQPHRSGGGQWLVCDEQGNSHMVLLSSCTRCPPSLKKRIMGKG